MSDIAVIGGGLSGALACIRLLEKPGLRVVLYEPGEPGRGLAYGAAEAQHLLNVRARNMSLFPEDPDHFLRWLECAAPEHASPEAFAPRPVFGRYVAAALACAAGRSGGRFEHRRVRAVALAVDADGASVTDADGETREVRAAVLALGNAAPRDPPGIDAARLGPAWAGDPWAPGVLDAVEPEARVLMVGTGLTMIDVVLSLHARGWRGSGTALSRRGLLPVVHTGGAPPPRPQPPARAPLSRALADFRAEAEDRGFRDVLDGLRPHNAALWGRLSSAERRRFLRHLRPWWDTARHRVAPQVWDRVRGLIAQGRLETVAGRLLVLEPAPGGGAEAVFRPRGSTETRRERFDLVLNCTGPDPDVRGRACPLVRGLLESGAAVAHPTGLGLASDAAGRLLDARGAAQPALRVVGPLRQGDLWESVAVPEIRVQAAELAGELCADLRPRPAGARGAARRLFHEHPADVGETYAEHFGVAFRSGASLVAAGTACMIHAVVPAVFVRTASETVKRIHEDLHRRTRRPVPPT